MQMFCLMKNMKLVRPIFHSKLMSNSLFYASLNIRLKDIIYIAFKIKQYGTLIVKNLVNGTDFIRYRFSIQVSISLAHVTSCLRWPRRKTALVF